MPALTKSMLEKENASLREQIAQLEKRLESLPLQDSVEENLSESETLLNQVRESTLDAVFAIDHNYCLLVNNQHHQQALIDSGGHPLQVGESVLSPDYPPEVNAYWRAAYERAFNGEAFKLETNWTDTAGQVNTSENNFTPLRDVAGAIVGALVVVHDVTENKRAEAALQELNNTLEQRVAERIAELRKSELKFTTLFENTPIAMGLVRLSDNRYVDVNPAMLKLFDYAREEMVGRTAQEINLRVDLQERQRFLEQLQANQFVSNFEATHYHKSGRILKVLVSAQIVEIENEKCLLSQIVDITERKREQETLRASERKFAILFENSPIAMGLVRLRDSRYLDVNNAMLDLLGHAREEIIGKTSEEVGMWMDERERQRFFEELSAKKSVKNIEALGRHKSGNLIHALVSSQIVEIDQEKYILGQIVDITARKRAEQDLHESEQRFRTLVETAGEGILIGKPNGETLFANQQMAQMLGCHVDEILGKSALDFTFDDWKPQVLQKHQAINLGKQIRGEFKFRRKDGSAMWTVYSAAPMFNEQGEHIANFAMHTDITDRKHAEEKLRQSEEKFSNAFHESPAAVVLTGIASGKFIEANETFLSLFEYSRDEVIGHSSTELGMWSLAEYKSMDVRQSESGGLRNAEVQARSRSGRLIQFLFSSKPMELAGEACRITTLIDITEQKRAQTALVESNAKLEKLFEVLPVGISVLDHEGKVVKENPMLETILGLSSEGLARGDYRQRNYIHSNGTPILAHEFPSARILQGEASIYDVELGVVKENGETVWTNVSAAAVPFSDWKAVIATRDITERKRSEQILQEREHFISSILETSPAIIYVYDMETGRNAFSNNGITRLLGYSPEQVKLMGEKLFTEMVHPDDFAQVVAFQERIMRARDGEVLVSEQRARRQDGSWRTLQNYESPFLRNPDGSLRQKIGVAMDITAQRQAQRELEQALARLQAISRQLLEAQEKERRAIGRELHDEIGQSLTGLRILLQVAQRPPLEAHVDKLEQAQQVAGELIDRVSALSLDLRPPMLDDMGILPALLWFIERYESRTGVGIDFQHSGLQGVRFASAIETAVYRLVQEALTNIARHSGVEQAAVRVETNNASMNIFIEDMGAGFDVKSMLTQNDTGGLSGMRERVRLLEGEMEIASAPGRGARISIHLPLTHHGEKR